jgi:ribosomal protein S21
MLIVVDDENCGNDRLIKMWKNKFDKTRILKLLRKRRYFVKKNDIKKIQRASSLYLQRKMTAALDY